MNGCICPEAEPPISSGFSTVTIDRLIKAGELTAYKHTRRVLIPREAIEELPKGERMGRKR